MTKTTQELKTEIQKTMSLLYTLRDEARVKLHLAEMNMKDAWTKLEPKIDEAEKLAEHATEVTLARITKTAKRIQELGRVALTARWGSALWQRIRCAAPQSVRSLAAGVTARPLRGR